MPFSPGAHGCGAIPRQARCRVHLQAAAVVGQQQAGLEIAQGPLVASQLATRHAEGVRVPFREDAARVEFGGVAPPNLPRVVGEPCRRTWAARRPGRGRLILIDPARAIAIDDPQGRRLRSSTWLCHLSSPRSAHRVHGLRPRPAAAGRGSAQARHAPCGWPASQRARVRCGQTGLLRGLASHGASTPAGTIAADAPSWAAESDRRRPGRTSDQRFSAISSACARD